MFTGIVQAIGEVRAITPRGGDVEMLFATGALSLEGVATGDSISVSGCCLTVTRLTADSFAADASLETLQVTTLGRWQVGQRVNLEKALRAGDALGGHYVTGHVDGVATVVSTATDARSLRMNFDVPAPLARYIARKGSVCIDGVSLTIPLLLRQRWTARRAHSRMTLVTVDGSMPIDEVTATALAELDRVRPTLS